nr:retrovirus-related Pol polyprotein from transposon TNT 1-94 [Tanacetum cinerariifolium]
MSLHKSVGYEHVTMNLTCLGLSVATIRNTCMFSVSSSGLLKIGKYLHFSLCSGSETKKGLCKEFQFSLVDNSKLSVVYLLNRSLKRFVSLLDGLQGGKKIVLASQRKPEIQWTSNERKAANLDQRLKSLIMYVLPDDEINSVINCLTARSTWDDLILYHEGPSDVKKSRSPFQTKLLQSSEHKPELKHTKEFEAKYSIVKAKLALLSSSTSTSNSSLGKNKGLIAKTYEWDEEVSSDENEGMEVKAFMALTDEERVSVGKESASNGELVKISIQK